MCSCANRDNTPQEFSKVVTDNKVSVHDNFGLKMVGNSLLMVSKSLPPFRSTVLRLTKRKGNKHHRLQAVMENKEGTAFDQILVDVDYFSEGVFEITIEEYDHEKESIEIEGGDGFKELFMFSEAAVRYI